jgi:hypothetical protein
MPIPAENTNPHPPTAITERIRLLTNRTHYDRSSLQPQWLPGQRRRLLGYQCEREVVKLTIRIQRAGLAHRPCRQVVLRQAVA